MTIELLRIRIHRTGLWAAARWACKHGVPIEMMLAAIHR